MMPIKGLFNHKQNHENIQINMEEYKKQIRRINTLEVHLDRLLKLETKVHPLLKLKDQLDRESNKTFEKNQQSQEEQKAKFVLDQNAIDRQQLSSYDRRIEEIRHELNGIAHKDKRKTDEKDLLKYFRQHLSSQDRKIDALSEKLNAIEQSTTRSPNVAVGDEVISYQQYLENPFLEKSTDDSFAGSMDNKIVKKLPQYNEQANYIEERILALESNILLVNEVQADILKRMTGMNEELAEFRHLLTKTSDKKSDQGVVVKEIRIDKFFLDKYEQNNNIAQIGIKELSGALNIGATYGSGVLPGELTEQLKEDMEELKGAKEDLVKTQTVSPEDESANSNEPFKSEEETIYSEIPLENISEETFTTEIAVENLSEEESN
jgi:hypothetical protein